MLRYIVRNNKYCRLINSNTILKNSDTNSVKNITSNIKRYIGGDSEQMSNEGGDKLKALSDKEWKKRLTHEQYDICRQKGTEMPFSGKYTFHKEEGLYNCVCCGSTLFSSKAKYISGCGWPSFTEPYPVEGKEGKKKTNVEEREDHSHEMKRTEVVCSECNAHLGHVFPDGPPPRGLRYCINSTSLKFQKKKLE